MFGQNLDPQMIVARLLIFVLAITVHEFMHAFTAYRLGDPTAARLGRVTLNPVAHFDPFGFLFSVLLVLGIAPIAWGKPVPVNPGNFRNPKRGMMLVAAAGPLSNLVLAVLFAVVFRFIEATGAAIPSAAGQLIVQGIGLNVALAAFNMIPVPPLDGHKILTGLLPDFWYPILAPMEQYGFVILLVILFLPNFIPGLGLNFFSAAATPLVIFLMNILAPGLI